MKLSFSKLSDRFEPDQTWQFFVACREGDVRKAKRLHSRGNVDINFVFRVDPDRKSFPLYEASVQGHVEVVNFLLGIPTIKANQNVKFNRRFKFNVACAACYYSQLDVLKALYQSSVVLMNRGSPTPLFIACERNCAGLVDYLLTIPQIDVNAASYPLNENNPHRDRLQVEQERNNLNSTRSSILDKYRLTPMGISCKLGHIDVVNLLLKHPKTNVNTSAYEPYISRIVNQQPPSTLQIAILAGNELLTKTLLESRKVSLHKNNNPSFWCDIFNLGLCAKTLFTSSKFLARVTASQLEEWRVGTVGVKRGAVKILHIGSGLQYFGQVKRFQSHGKRKVPLPHGFGVIFKTSFKSLQKNNLTRYFVGSFLNGKKHGIGVSFHSNHSPFQDKVKIRMQGVKKQWEHGRVVKLVDPESVKLFEVPLTAIEDQCTHSNRISQGGFATVYKIQYEGVQVAAKIMRFVTPQVRNEYLPKLIRSLRILKSLVHPNLVQVHATIKCSNSLDFGWLLDYQDGGDLNELVTVKALSFKTKIKALYDVVLGMEYLHMNSVMHRDLKLSNILYSKRVDMFKICDFDTLKKDDNSPHSRFPRQNHSTSCIGSPFYADPIIHSASNDVYDMSCDVYSFGIVIAAVLTNTAVPFDLCGDKCGACGEAVSKMYASKSKHIGKPCMLRPPVDLCRKGIEDEEFLWLIDVMQKCWGCENEKRISFETMKKIFDSRLLGKNK